MLMSKTDVNVSNLPKALFCFFGNEILKKFQN